MVGPVVWAVFMLHESRAELKAKFGKEWATDQEYAEWLIQKERGWMNGEQVMSKVTNMCRVFVWAAEVVRAKVGQQE